MIGAIDGAAASPGAGRPPLGRALAGRALARRALELAHPQLPAVPVADRIDERLALGVAVLAEQVHLVAEPHQRGRQARVVDVRPRPVQQVAVEDQDAHGRAAYPRRGSPAHRLR